VQQLENDHGTHVPIVQGVSVDVIPAVSATASVTDAVSRPNTDSNELVVEALSELEDFLRVC
jgi:hypothetical protein